MIRELEKNLGVPVRAVNEHVPKGLPFYLKDRRSFRTVDIAKVSVLLVTVTEDEVFGAIALEKQLVKYEEAAGMPAAYNIRKISKKQRDALIRRNIPFISLPEQIYLPFLGISLSEKFWKQKRINTQRMTPSSQALFLYFLYRAKGRSVIKKQAAMELNMSGMSVTRASEQLVSMQLITQETRGKERYMRAVACGKAYYDLALPYLINPVQRAIVVKKTKKTESLPMAGETALSQRSMMNAPVVPSVALEKGSALLPTLTEVDERWEDENRCVRVECWKYDPNLFAWDNCVDPISMAASLNGLADERLQGELEQYLEEMSW